MSVGLVVSLIWLAGFVWFAERLPRKVENIEALADVIVVLTGGSGRLSEGLKLLSEGRARRLFISGVYRGMDVKRLLQMYQESPLGMEGRVNIGNATNTRGNARETAEWIYSGGYRSLRLVTANYHMPRSLLEFYHIMPDVKIEAHPVFPKHVKADEWWFWPGTTGLIAGEFNKFLLAKVRHVIERLLMGRRDTKNT